MKKIITLFTLLLSVLAQSQTTEYTTGQTYPDAWTGWSTPVTTNVTSSSVNGANIYTFSGTSGYVYTIETYRQFTINSNDIDLYLNATTQNATVSIEYSTDNVSYTQIGTQNWGPGFSLSTLIVPTYNPVVSTFYLKLKMTGTFGSPSQATFNNFKIDAVLNAGNTTTIAPTTTQNITQSTNGTVLTATELPSAATSREWKYSTTSGSGYISFAPTQTGTSYTPNFATAGTYYVVCVSNFAGDVKTSNEVQINVTAPATVNEFQMGSSVFYANGALTVNTGIINYNVQIFDLNGRLIGSHANMKSFDFADYEAGLYFVAFTYNDERKTIKIAHTN